MITGKSIKGALNYNEQKVLEGNAECIYASGFIKELHDMAFYDKLNRFEDLNDKNRRSKTNTLHISLNFDLTEKLDKETLSSIAAAYMEKIGFGNQPFLVYQHLDAAHPHVHIVSTCIQQNGRRIPLHNIGRNQSEKARKEIEQKYNLVKAESKALKPEQPFVIQAAKATYGKSETKRSISNVVRMVVQNYKYTSLAELNAVLKQYNVTADRGKEGTTMFEKKGLMYSILDAKGNKIGIPIKASAIYGKPTLPFLENQFRLNEALREPYKVNLKNTIDKVLNSQNSITRNEFSERLKQQGIYALFRENGEGQTYGITFVDNRFKTVFNGSNLGKSYSAKRIMERLSVRQNASDHFRPRFSETFIKPAEGKKEETDIGFTNLIADLLMAETHYQISPEAALRLKRKKKGRSLHRR